MPEAAAPGRRWQRFGMAERLARFAVYLAVVIAVVAAARTVEIIPEFLYDAPEQMHDLLVRMWPVDYRYYPAGIHDALMETLEIATVGTLLAILLAIPLGLLAAANLTPNRLVNFIARTLLVASRSVNSLVWALLFVGVFGPGPLAGMLAIAFRSIGFVGKLLGEAIEETSRGPVEALTATGANTGSLILYAYWPQIKPAFWALVLLRWDINVRESAVLGLVGAGGIGMVLDTTLNLFQWDRTAMVLVAIFVIVIIAELVVTRIRQRIL